MAFLKSIVAVPIIRVQSSDVQHSVISGCRLGQIEREQRDVVLVAEHEATGTPSNSNCRQSPPRDRMDQQAQAFGAFVMVISKPQGYDWVHVEQVGDELVLRSRAQLFTAAGWLALFLLFTALFVIATAPRAPTLWLWYILINMFVIAMCIPVACFSLRWFLSTECLRIGPDGLDYQSRFLIPLLERHVPLGEIKGIDYSLEIETLGKPVRFWGNIGPRERRWLADLLQRHLQALMPDLVITLQPPDLGAVTKLTVPIEVLGPAGATPEPPRTARSACIPMGTALSSCGGRRLASSATASPPSISFSTTASTPSGTSPV